MSLLVGQQPSQHPIATPTRVQKINPNLYWNHYLLSFKQDQRYRDFFYFNFFSDKDLRSALLSTQSVTLNRYLVLRKSSITSFFSANLIDMPICFKKSHSLYTKTFELPLFKFINLVMRDGRRASTLKVVTSGFNSLFLNLYKSQFQSVLNWQFIIHLFSLTHYAFQGQYQTNYFNSTDLLFHKNMFLEQKDFSFFPDQHLFQEFLNRLDEFIPTFSFYIRRVNKDLRKNSRGKSGKYMITWKYVPTYKRIFLTMRWFIKDLKFQNAATLKIRFKKLLENFFFQPETSFVHKVRRFVHRYVFKNFKKTLLRTLKSV